MSAQLRVIETDKVILLWAAGWGHGWEPLPSRAWGQGAAQCPGPLLYLNRESE